MNDLKKLKLSKYVIRNCFEDLGLPITYQVHIKCRNKIDGTIRYFSKGVYNEKNVRGKELDDFLRKVLERLINLKTQSGYEFIPYEESEA